MEQPENNIAVPVEANVETTSLMTRITNVFASPSELYNEVSVAPVQNSSWITPLIFSIFMALLFVVAIYFNNDLRSQIYERQAEALKAQVEQGKISQERYEQYVEGMEQSGFGMFVGIGGVSAIVMTLIVFFGATLILWLAAKIILKFPGKYTKVLEVFSLASFIGLFGSIITLLMMYVFGSMTATPSPGIFLSDNFDIKNKVHIILANLNIFTIWQIGIVGLGLSKISNKSTGLGLGVTFGLWIVWVLISTFLGFGMR
jgi:hypothetical protein